MRQEAGPNRATKGSAAPIQRRVAVNFKQAKFETYSLQGTPQNDVTWCNLSYDHATGEGFFLIRFAPNGRSIAHEHVGFEEFVVLEGEITDSDGTTFRTGDCVSQPPGSKHYSTSAKGCVTAVFIRGGFRTLGEGESLDSGKA